MIHKKLDQEQVRAIYLGRDRTARQLAAEFGVSHTTIKAIREKKAWVWLTDQLDPEAIHH